MRYFDFGSLSSFVNYEVQVVNVSKLCAKSELDNRQAKCEEREQEKDGAEEEEDGEEGGGREKWRKWNPNRLTCIACSLQSEFRARYIQSIE